MHRVFLRNRSRGQWAAFAVYLLLQSTFNYLEFGLVFFIVALIGAIFLNLNWISNRKEGQLSAYSVFNPGGTRLVRALCMRLGALTKLPQPGTYDATEYERMLRSGGGLVAK